MTGEDLRVKGFSAAAVKSGIRGKDRLDMGLIASDVPADGAAVFTTNRVKAAPVLLGMEHLAAGRIQAILVNSGIANACTGEEGMAKARMCAAMAADALDIDQELVQVASTGVIGMQLDLECFRFGVPKLVKALASEGLPDVARAIMTTDTVPKWAVREFSLDGKPVRMVGIAKGAGMIMPNMATMLCFILTDAAIEQRLLARTLKDAVRRTFNRITVDGDTSTNDTVMILANGRAANPRLRAGCSGEAVFRGQLTDLCRDLARAIVRDGEGATKLVTIRVAGAASEIEAEAAARTVANSCLVKTAFFGEDANWGRIIAALGRSGARFDPGEVSITFDDVVVVAKGVARDGDTEARATQVLKQKEFEVGIDLHRGEGEAEVVTCDLSIDYVKINAEYRT